jgi:hypothetical protein
MKDKELREALVKANVFYNDNLMSTFYLDRALELNVNDLIFKVRKEIEVLRQENKALRELLNVEYVDTSFKGLQKGEKKVAFK